MACIGPPHSIHRHGQVVRGRAVCVDSCGRQLWSQQAARRQIKGSTTQGSSKQQAASSTQARRHAGTQARRHAGTQAQKKHAQHKPTQKKRHPCLSRCTLLVMARRCTMTRVPCALAYTCPSPPPCERARTSTHEHARARTHMPQSTAVFRTTSSSERL